MGQLSKQEFNAEISAEIFRRHKRKNKAVSRAIVDLTFKELRLHPNFCAPDLPETNNSEDIAKYVVDFIAMFISPPMEEDENNEFACTDLKAAILGPLKKEILKNLKHVKVLQTRLTYSGAPQKVLDNCGGNQ